MECECGTILNFLLIFRHLPSHLPLFFIPPHTLAIQAAERVHSGCLGWRSWAEWGDHPHEAVPPALHCFASSATRRPGLGGLGRLGLPSSRQPPPRFLPDAAAVAAAVETTIKKMRKKWACRLARTARRGPLSPCVDPRRAARAALRDMPRALDDIIRTPLLRIAGLPSLGAPLAPQTERAERPPIGG